MRDIHCHILPGVDDGAADLDESLAMLEAAKRAGVTRIVCTPHCRDPYFDYDKMWDAFELLRDNADGFPLQMGFEVNHRKLVELGIDAAEHLHFDGTNEFLLELSTRATEVEFKQYERTIYTSCCNATRGIYYYTTYDNHQISLTNREFQMLKVLLENQDIVLTRDVLLERVCGYDYVGETNVVDVYIRFLRSKIDQVFQVKMIQTIRGVGYVIKSEE